MKIPIRNLTRDEALAAAQAARTVSGQAHSAVLLRNGRWKWGRRGWAHQILVERHALAVFVAAAAGSYWLRRGKDPNDA